MTLTSGFRYSKVEPRAYLYIILGRNPKFGVRIYFGIMAWRIHFCCMRGSRILFWWGGGGGPGRTARKQSGLFCFFSPQLILKFTECIQWFYNRESLTFEGPRGDPTFSRGSNFFHGGPNAYLYRNPYNL